MYIVFEYIDAPGTGMGQPGVCREDIVYITLDQKDAQEVAKALNDQAAKDPRKAYSSFKAKRHDLANRAVLGLEVEKELSIEEINKVLEQRIREINETVEPIKFGFPGTLRRMPNPPFPDET